MSRFPTPYPRMIAVIRNLAHDARTAETYEQRDPIINKLIRQLDLLEQRIAKVAEDRGRLGGQKTAERGPDYFREIAAKRKTRAGGRPRKTKPEVPPQN